MVTPQNVDGFVIAAYAALGNDHYDTPFSLWPYGNVRSDDAYKEAVDKNDIQTFHFFEISNNIRPDFGELDGLLYLNYVGIGRCNKAIAALNQLSETAYPNKQKRIAEMKFVRGHFIFVENLFKYVPYVDENTPMKSIQISQTELKPTNNCGMPSLPILNLHLPICRATQAEVGRPKKSALLPIWQK